MKAKWFQYALHFLIWTFFYFLPYLISFEGETNIRTIFSHPGDYVHLVSFLLLVLFTYVNHFVLLPSLYFRKSYVLYFVAVLIGLFVVVWLPGLFISFGPKPGPPPMAPPPLLFGRNYNIILFLISVFVSMSIQIRFQLLRMQQERLNAELSFLKAQINPHFLFNSLNSIYSLAIQKSDNTADAVVQLSNLMRYIIKDAASDKVELKKELDYLMNYIEVQKNRLHHTAAINVSVAGDAGGYFIAPLILMSFIENAFKHGVNPDEDSRIHIEITLTQGKLQFMVSNKKVTSVNNDEFTGIGLHNTHKRLQHLYPGKHTLIIKDSPDQFTVNLTLEL